MQLNACNLFFISIYSLLSSQNILKVNKMTAQNLAIATVAILAILFVMLLILGIVFSSVATIVSAFVCGFIGFAIVDHESQVEYENSNKELNK